MTSSPAFYEERLRLLEAECHQLRATLAVILALASTYHGSSNRQANALSAITVRARDALDGEMGA